MKRQRLNRTQSATANPPQTTVNVESNVEHPILQLQAELGNHTVNQLIKNQESAIAPPQIRSTKPTFGGLSQELRSPITPQSQLAIDQPENLPGEANQDVVQCMRSSTQLETDTPEAQKHLEELSQSVEQAEHQTSSQVSNQNSASTDTSSDIGSQTDPTPKVKSQWGFGSGKFIVDLNCGWYCQIAGINYWAEKLNLELPPNILPKNAWLAYSPGHEGQEFAQPEAPPNNATSSYWKQMLAVKGPLMVSGKLGAASWLPVGGHYVLIVDVDVQENKFKYLDPLQAGAIKSDDFDSMQARIKKIYSINTNALKEYALNKS